MQLDKHYSMPGILRKKYIKSGPLKIGILFLILLFYFFSHLYIIDKPGLQEDEGNVILPSMQLAYGREISYGMSVDLGGIHYPTMVGPYTGNNLTLLVAAVIYIFGFKLALVRLAWVLVSIGVMIFTFLVCRELFNDWVGLLASFFLAVSPSFWMYNHVGAHVQANMPLDIMGSLFFFLYFYRIRRPIYLVWAMFFLGHGIYTKLAFGYFIIAYLVSFFILLIRGNLARDIVNLKYIIYSFAAFLAGSWPLLYFMVLTGGPFTILKTALTGSSLTGQSNLDIWQNLILRLNQMWSYLLEGHAPGEMILPGISIKYDPVMPYIFWFSLLFLSVSILWPGQRFFDKKKIAFVVFVFCVFQLLIIFTPSTFNYAVFVFIIPFVSIILALAFISFYQTLLSSHIPRLSWLVIAGMVALVYFEMNALVSQYNQVRITGGRGVWSSAIFQLNGYLLEHPDRTPVALDWGLETPISLLSGLKINPSLSYFPFTSENGNLVLWQITPPPSFNELMQKMIYQPQNIYLVRVEKYTAFHGRLAALNLVAEKNGAKLIKIHSVFESDSQEFIQVYEIQWTESQGQNNEIEHTPMISQLSPNRSPAGVKFNEQPNGQAAIAIMGSNFEPDSIVYFDDQPLDTTFGNSDLLTAIVPNNFIDMPGRINVYVINKGYFKSNSMFLDVTK